MVATYTMNWEEIDELIDSEAVYDDNDEPCEAHAYPIVTLDRLSARRRNVRLMVELRERLDLLAEQQHEREADDCSESDAILLTQGFGSLRSPMDDDEPSFDADSDTVRQDQWENLPHDFLE